ncbi:MAG: DUF1631 family protein [Xanthomonadaceae bacterium]|nr:DUF1631 family protein [Xanthomonadaceae bacterium]
MDVGQEQRHSRATPSPAGVDSGRWPPRARHLLETSYTMMAQGLHEPLRRCLGSFAQQLFALADRAHDNAEQQDCFASRQRVLRDRSAFEERFLAQLAKAFSGIDANADATSPEGATGWASLELLDPVEQELSMAVERLGARGETQHSSVLYELGYRFAVLVGSPPLDGEALPLGPHALAKACHQAGGELALPMQHQLLLFSNFDQQVIRTLTPLYGSINAQLLADGILPKLRSNPIPRLVKQPPRTGTAEAEAAAAATEPPRTADGTAAPQGSSIEVLESLRNLLAQRRGGHGTAGESPVERVASADELQTALAALQQHLAQVTDRAGRELRSAQRLREELLAQLNVNRPSGAPRTQLSGEQGDTVELVAMLFEQIGQQLKQGGNAHALLGNLQLPVLRLAVTDHEFFEQREHPARKLLDKVTEVANDWLDGNDDESDRALATTLEQLVARTHQEPPSAGLYTTLLADIEHHLSLLSRKAQAAERRHTEAARGRERLDQARRRAAEVMAERFAQSPPRGLLRTLMDRAWSDVLALTLLRHGEDSDAFKTQLVITDQLLGRLPIDDRQHLRHEVEAGLQQIGMPAEEAIQATRRLLDAVADTAADEVRQSRPAQAPAGAAEAATPPAGKVVPAPAVPPASPPAMAAPPGDDLPSATMLARRLKQHQRPGAQHERDTQPARTGHQNSASMPVLGPQEASIHNRLRKLPYGSWFEFLDPVSGQRTQRKLAWFSPVTGNVLFVNRRGARSEQMNLQELAHAIAKGRVRELPPQRESLLDRAWLGLTRSLRQDADARRAAAPESDRR